MNTVALITAHIFVAAAFGFSVYTANTENKIIRRKYPTRSAPIAFWSPLLLLFQMGIIFLFDVFVPGVASYFAETMLPHLVFTCVYICVLLLILPTLRRFLRPEACAALWTLPGIAAYVYIYTRNMDFAPLWVLKLPLTLPRWIGSAVLVVWVTGFCGILLWQLCSHLLFRWKLLGMAWEVTDPRILSVWFRELVDAKLDKTGLRIFISPQTATPLSIGLFSTTLRVVLPYKAYKDYTDEELSLIFRHELKHIQGKDTFTKLNLMIYTALFWFHPLMWVAMGRCADDLELSCDQAVVRGSDPDARRRYAELILNTAGDSRGFTTALSTSAKGLRHRLRGIVAPKRLYSGGILCFMIAAAFLLTVFADIGFGGETAETMIFHGQDPAQFQVQAVFSEDAAIDEHYDQPRSGAELAEYLFDQRLWKLTATDMDSSADPHVQFTLFTEQSSYCFFTDGKFLEVIESTEARRSTSVYYFETPLDLDQLLAGLRPDASAPCTK